MRKIYVLGPSKVGKSTFINKYFPNQRVIQNCVENQEMEMPEEYLKVYLILPHVDKITNRQKVNLSDDEYQKWMNFYIENADKITLVEDF